MVMNLQWSIILDRHMPSAWSKCDLASMNLQVSGYKSGDQPDCSQDDCFCKARCRTFITDKHCICAQTARSIHSTSEVQVCHASLSPCRASLLLCQATPKSVIEQVNHTPLKTLAASGPISSAQRRPSRQIIAPMQDENVGD